MKKTILIIYFTAVFLLCYATNAFAVFGTLAVAVVSVVAGAAGVTISATAAGVIAAIANSAAIAAISSAFREEPNVSGIGTVSPTYDGALPQATIAKGSPIYEAYGLARLPGNLVRTNDADAESYIEAIVVHSKEIDEVLGYYINDVDFTDFNGDHTIWSHLGKESQAPIDNIFDDAETTNFRGFNVSEVKLKKGNEIRSLSNINQVVRARPCIEIGEDEVESSGESSAFSQKVYTENPSQILWDNYLSREGYTVDQLDENAFLALEAYCGVVPDSEVCLIRPPILNDDLVLEATRTDNRRFKAKYAIRSQKSLINEASFNSWREQATANKRINFDFGRHVALTKIKLENYHNIGSDTDMGIQDFAFEGSNDRASFLDTTYASTGWTTLISDTASEHSASNAPDPEEFTIDESDILAYRYYSIVIDNNYGDGTYSGFRDLKFYGRTERYSFNMVFDSKISYNDAKKLMWRAFNGKVITSQGKLKPVWEGAEEHDGVGGLQVKVVKHAFTESNIIKGSFEREKLSKPNVVRVYYIDVNNEFEKTDPVELRDIHDIAVRGEVIHEEMDYFINNHALASRRCQLVFNKRYLEDACTLTGFPDSQDVEVYDRVTVTHSKPGWTTKDFFVAAKTEDMYGRPKFRLIEYLSGIYSDDGFEIQDSYTVRRPNPNEPPPQAGEGEVTISFNSVGSASYAKGTLSVAFTPPNDPDYLYTQAYISTNGDSSGSDYVEAGPISTGEDIIIHGMGVYYSPGDTVYVKMKHYKKSGVSNELPDDPDDDVAVPGTGALGKYAGFYFGDAALWGGNADITNALTKIVLTLLGNPYFESSSAFDHIPAFKMGDNADNIEFENGSAYPGAYMDGEGFIRLGGSRALRYNPYTNEIVFGGNLAGALSGTFEYGASVDSISVYDGPSGQTTYSSYTLMKEFRIGYGGTYDIEIGYRTLNDLGHLSYTIYLNMALYIASSEGGAGVLIAGSQTGDISGGPTTYLWEDIELQVGDYLQLKAKYSFSPSNPGLPNSFQVAIGGAYGPMQLLISNPLTNTATQDTP